MKKILNRFGVLLIALGLSSLAFGQGRRDALEQFLFPPELVMRNQQELQLTSEQREYIVEQIQQAQGQFTSLRWDLEGALEQLSGLLKSPKPDESDVLAKLDAVLDFERQIKRTQLVLAVRIKGILTAAQIEKLEQLRPRPRLAPPPDDPGRPRPRDDF